MINRHHRRYDKMGLQRLIENSGFAVRELRYFFIWPLGLMYLRKLLHGTKQRAREVVHCHRPSRPSEQTVRRPFAYRAEAHATRRSLAARQFTTRCGRKASRTVMGRSPQRVCEYSWLIAPLCSSSRTKRISMNP